MIEVVKDQVTAQITTMIKHKLSYLAKWFALGGTLILAFGASLIIFPAYTPYIIGGVSVVISLVLFGIALKLALWR